MIPFNAWTKSKNEISIFDPDFVDESDDFQILFVQRGICLKVTIDVESVEKCEGRIAFNFVLDCELQEGKHDATLTNVTKSTVVFSDYPTKVFDVPSECVKNSL